MSYVTKTEVRSILGVASDATRAVVSTNLSGGNNDLTFTAVQAGFAGNTVSVTYVNPNDNDQPLVVSVTDSAITVSLATGVAGAITSTANAILAALTADAEASALIVTTLKQGSNGTGVVTAMSELFLTGGADGVDDARLDILIDAMEETFNQIIGVDSLLEDTYTEVVKGSDHYYFRLRNFNVTEVTTIKEIRRTEDTTIPGWSVRRIDGRTVWFDTVWRDGVEYLVTYDAGLEAIPSSVKLAIAYMVGGSLAANEGKGEGIKSYTIFGKSVTFRDPNEFDKFSATVHKYARMYRKAEVFTI